MALVTLLQVSSVTSAAPPELSKLVPIDSVAAYFGPGEKEAGDPPQSGIGSTLDVLTFLADRAAQMGLFSSVDSCSRMWIDALTTLSTIDHYSHAVVVHGVQSRSRSDGGHELAGLRIALILRTDGADGEVERRIQHLLTTYTNTEDTVLTNTTVSGRLRFVLRDRRLPRWAKITWGAFGDYFVAALGDGAFESVATLLNQKDDSPNPRSLADDAWFVRAYDRLAKKSGNQESAAERPSEERSIALFFNMRRLSQSVDASLAGKIEEMQSALDLDHAESAVWYAGRIGRAIEVRGMAHRKGQDKVGVLASPDLLKHLGPGVVPDEARGFGVVNLDPRTAFPAACNAYLAARSHDARESSRAFWRNVERRSKVSIERDIVSHLRGPVVIHNYPRQALGLPFAWTVVVPVGGDAATIRLNMARLLNHARELIDPEDILRIVHEEIAGVDPAGGVWHLQYGFIGPAIAVTDKWLVLSFSSQALRTNLALLESKQRNDATDHNVTGP